MNHILRRLQVLTIARTLGVEGEPPPSGDLELLPIKHVHEQSSVLVPSRGCEPRYARYDWSELSEQRVREVDLAPGWENQIVLRYVVEPDHVLVVDGLHLRANGLLDQLELTVDAQPVLPPLRADEFETYYGVAAVRPGQRLAVQATNRFQAPGPPDPGYPGELVCVDVRLDGRLYREADLMAALHCFLGRTVGIVVKDGVMIVPGKSFGYGPNCKKITARSLEGQLLHAIAKNRWPPEEPSDTVRSHVRTALKRIGVELIERTTRPPLRILADPGAM